MRPTPLVAGLCLAFCASQALAGWPAEDLPTIRAAEPTALPRDTATSEFSNDPDVLFGQVCQWATSNLAFAEQQGDGLDLANYLAKTSVTELVSPDQMTLRGAMTRVLIDLQTRLASEPAQRREQACRHEMAQTAGMIKQHWAACQSISVAVGQAIAGESVDTAVLDRAVPSWRELPKIFSPAESGEAAEAFNRWCLLNGQRGYTFTSQYAD